MSTATASKPAWPQFNEPPCSAGPDGRPYRPEPEAARWRGIIVRVCCATLPASGRVGCLAAGRRWSIRRLARSRIREQVEAWRRADKRAWPIVSGEPSDHDHRRSTRPIVSMGRELGRLPAGLSARGALAGFRDDVVNQSLIAVSGLRTPCWPRRLVRPVRSDIGW
jgi:hypothetical protein